MSYPEGFSLPNQDEANVPRFTSEVVLTTGIEQGWADPVNPRDVDFSQRPSFMGPLDFDDDARPLNPHRTPDMPGDRGHLGKWGPNNAADPVVVANGKILLIRRKDTGQWALPGGMVDPGEYVSLTARRELLEEAGIDLGQVEGDVIYEGYVDDPRNTRNAWMETTARLFRIDHNPQPRAGDDAAEARWFDCPDMDTLVAATQQFDVEQGLPAQPLYASHDAIISAALQKVKFEQLMSEAVRLHGQRRYEAALALSTQAYEIAPDNSFEKGRAARDNSARYDRLGRAEEAEVWAEKAYAIHNDLVESMEHATREAFRERSVSGMYVGVSGLRRVIRARREGQDIDGTAPLDAMRQAWSDLQAAKTQAQGVNQEFDQYEINAARRVSMAESVLGSTKTGLVIGARAVALAFWSESPRLDTSNPNMPSRERIQAKVKALLGGVAAIGVGVLAATRTERGTQLATVLADKTL